jgi:hypothetical protein
MRRNLGAICCLLLAARRAFAAFLANAGVDAIYFRVFLGFFLGVQLSLQSREAIEEQLGNVSQGYSVAAGDAFEGELPGEITEKGIHGTGGGEVADVAEKIGSEDFGGDSGNGDAKTVGVVGTESGMMRAVRELLVLVD